MCLVCLGSGTKTTWLGLADLFWSTPKVAGNVPRSPTQNTRFSKYVYNVTVVGYESQPWTCLCIAETLIAKKFYPGDWPISCCCFSPSIHMDFYEFISGLETFSHNTFFTYCHAPQCWCVSYECQGLLCLYETPRDMQRWAGITHKTYNHLVSWFRTSLCQIWSIHLWKALIKGTVKAVTVALFLGCEN